ncbi:hypothetical protein GCM10010233_61880 [Streptomyces pseudogriseolus]|uniref:Homeodomain-like domain-containing protein n=1 Tax=Streptomyces pseudogriseolus TaxID=36817 RepID=A0ABQ2TJW6_STREZ|nr:hypothetical protein GCM10010233_61880 [Streptomyces gancidicus]GGS74007.1 hypothetical protein GCM10010285_60980 [Streptomyces rubiginosus]
MSAPLNWLADLIRGHLRKIGSRWRAPPAGRNATIVLAALRCDQRPGDLAGGNGIHRTTVTRWAWEAVGLPAARVPRLGAGPEEDRPNGWRSRAAGRIGDPYPA